MDIRQLIDDNIKKFNPDKLFDSSMRFFEKLNYPMDTMQEEANYTLDEFLEMVGYNGENKLKNYGISSIEILFNLSEDEMASKIDNFYVGKIGDSIIEAYLFLAIKLDRDSYSKTKLVNISKGINKLLNSPAFILFTYDNKITLSVTDRRINKKDEDKDVLEKTTLIKDIGIKKTHRAHLDILSKLDFKNLGNKQNFQFFHNSLKKVLNTKELNKKFYKEISNWYFWANEVVKFPTDLIDKDGKQISQEKSNSENTIRFITRMIFVWFLKEKNLVQENIFDKDYIYKNIIKEGADKTGSTYYKAILQNLFFGTLNTEMNKDKEGNRTFINHTGNKSKEYGIHTYYRYKRFLQNEAENLIVNLFNDIPFLNGGLFECLDHTTNRRKDEIRVDMYSDNPKNEDKLIFPDELLFGEEKDYDLNKVYFTSKKPYKVRGLFEILNDYKFTVEENTPLEEDVALDPELLGEIFENLLASYNEETSTTARKQTGSFYTPREIVNYMVDSSVKEYLKTNLSFVTDEKLDSLFRIDNPVNEFNSEETKKLVEALDKIKILDPACGSGAFPMGILNRLVKLLEVLDPENLYWKTLRINGAQTKDNAEEMLKEIKQIFDMDKYTANYSRKLFLIENSIYGLDIQPMATQITKLRFFISLVIEQNMDETKENNGILTLPNLETKFLSVNSLVGLNISHNHWASLKVSNYEKLKKQLHEIRHNHFLARTSTIKNNWRKKDEAKREEIKQELLRYKWDEVEVEKITSWNPYKQNEVSEFFDFEFMFEEKDKFDIVIGNPPYGASYSKEHKELFKNDYITAQTKNGLRGSLDTFSLFIEKSYRFLENNGYISYIVPMSITSSDSMSALHNFLFKNSENIYISSFFDRPKKIFDNAEQPVSIFFAKKSVNIEKINLYTTKVNKRYVSKSILEILKDLKFVNSIEFIKFGRIPKIGTEIEKNILKKLTNISKTIENYIDKSNEGKIYYRTSGGRYYKLITNFSTGSSKESSINIPIGIRDLLGGILSSNLFFWYYHIYSNCRDFKQSELVSFPFDLDNFSEMEIEKISEEYNLYIKDIENNSKVKNVSYANVKQYKEYYPRYSKYIIDRIDMLLKNVYNLTEEEVDFLINFDIEFRIDTEDE